MIEVLKIKYYICTVCDKDGHISKEKRIAESKDSLIDSFFQTDFLLLDIKEIYNINIFKKTKCRKEVFDFTVLMNQLVSSGLTIKDALEICSHFSDNNIALLLLEKIRKGNSFSSAVDGCDFIFSKFYRSIIKIGDKVGSVERIFPRLKHYLEMEKKIREKVSTALVYPLFVLTTAFISAFCIIFFVIPYLEEIFSQFGGTAALQLKKSVFELKITCSVLVILVFLLVLMFFFLRGVRNTNEKFAEKIDSIILKLPGIEMIVKYFETANFAFAMEALTNGGLPVETAITESLLMVKNKSYKKALVEIKEQLVEGDLFSVAVSEHSEIPDYVSKWIAIGEETGKTEDIFIQIKDFYQQEIDKIISNFMSLIEPVLIFLIGCFLLILVMNIIVPIFNLYGSLL